MLDLGTNLGDTPIDVFVDGVEFAAFRNLVHNTPYLALCAERCLALGADVTFVGPDRRLLAVEQVVPDPAVVNLGRCRVQTVRYAAFGIGANVRLHTKILVVSLLRGRHLKVAGLGLVLGR